MTIGIALSVKSDLGVSPVSSIPYTMTLVFGIEMGKATIIFHVFLVLIQILLLRKNFKWINLFQILIGIVFGYFTTFCNYLVSLALPLSISDYFPNIFTGMTVRVCMTLVSTFFVALGIFFYMPSSIMPLAGEGCMMAVSQITKIQFHKVKISFDVTMVVISLITCLIALHSTGSVGIGTIAAAFLVGIILGFLNKFFGKWRDSLLIPETENSLNKSQQATA